jgi:hypothetical protein
MSDMLKAYIETALWSSTGDDDQPLDKTHGIEDIAPATLEQMEADCKAFEETATQWLTNENMLVSERGGSVMARAGHDFWLTRNGHGAGFWDGDWARDAGIALTNIAKPFGSVDLYVGDDNKIHCM